MWEYPISVYQFSINEIGIPTFYGKFLMDLEFYLNLH